MSYRLRYALARLNEAVVRGKLAFLVCLLMLNGCWLYEPPKSSAEAVEHCEAEARAEFAHSRIKSEALDVYDACIRRHGGE